jgi:hypothetical protein
MNEAAVYHKDSQGTFWTLPLLSDLLLSLHCTALHCTALHCTALHCTALHCTALHRTALHRTALHCTAPHRPALALPALSPPAPPPSAVEQGLSDLLLPTNCRASSTPRHPGGCCLLQWLATVATLNWPCLKYHPPAPSSSPPYLWSMAQ